MGADESAVRKAYRVGAYDRAWEHVRDAEEAGHERRRRPFVELVRSAELLDATAVHHRDSVGHRHRLLLVVGDVDEGDADVVLQALDEKLHLLPQLQIERAQRLVEQQDARAIDERARERDSLLLPTRELARLAFAVAAQLDEIEHFLDLALQVSSTRALSPQAEGDVLENREVREEGVALEDRVDIAFVGRRAADLALAEIDQARGRLLEPADHPQGRRLAAS